MILSFVELQGVTQNYPVNNITSFCGERFGINLPLLKIDNGGLAIGVFALKVKYSKCLMMWCVQINKLKL